MIWPRILLRQALDGRSQIGGQRQPRCPVELYAIFVLRPCDSTCCRSEKGLPTAVIQAEPRIR